MSQERQEIVEPVKGLTRRGKVVYEANPSVTGGRFRTRIMSGKSTHGGKAYMVASDTGQVIGEGAFGFVEEKEVDSAEFVKVYLDGIKQYGQLSKAGATIFELVYREISGVSGKDKDTVNLNYFLAQRWSGELSKRTYERGINELLEKEFIYRSIAADTYFVNVNFMFNGDRMVVVRQYRKAESTQQIELALPPPAA